MPASHTLMNIIIYSERMLAPMMTCIMIVIIIIMVHFAGYCLANFIEANFFNALA